MTLESNVKLTDNVFLQEVDGETILLDTETEEYFSLNEVGGIFYELLKEESNLALIVKELEEVFEGTPSQTIENDLVVFVKALHEKGLVSFS